MPTAAENICTGTLRLDEGVKLQRGPDVMLVVKCPKCHLDGYVLESNVTRKGIEVPCLRRMP